MIPPKVPTIHSVPHTSCINRGDIVSCHNRLRDVFLESCRQACIGARVEVGSGLGLDQGHTRHADVLVPDWMLGKPAAFDITVTSPLIPSTFTEASVMAGSAALAAEQRKHNANDVKCSELGCKCVPLAVESYGCWGTEAKAAPGTIGFPSCYTLQYLKVLGYLQFVQETQLVVLSNVFSRHLLDSVLHNNSLLVTLCLLFSNWRLIQLRVLLVPSAQISCWIPLDIMPLHVSMVGMWYFATTS